MVRISGYNTIKEVNRGASSVIYQAGKKQDGQTVALKILTPEAAEDSDERKRFQYEIDLLESLNEDLFLDIYDHGNYEGRPYMVLEYFDGENVKNLILSESSLVARHWMTIGIRTAQALSALHLEDIIHKDVKPENILVNEKLDTRLIDFSIAEELGFFSFNIFGGSEVEGTPTYMAPEQINGNSLDYRTDMYSLGITMYEMASGKPPFVGRTTQDILDKHRNQKPVPLVEKNESVPLEISDVIMKMIEKDPDDRYSDMNMVLWELKKYWDPPSPEDLDKEDDEELRDTETFGIENRDTRLISPGSYMYCAERDEESDYKKPDGERHSIMNFSRGGIGFSSATKFEKDKILDCLIVIPTINESFKMRGRVRWCRPGNEDDVEEEYSIGLKWLLLQKKYITKFEELKKIEETEIYY